MNALTRHWMAYSTRIDSGHLAHRAQHHIHPRTGEVVLDAPQVRVTAKGLAPIRTLSRRRCELSAARGDST